MISRGQKGAHNELVAALWLVKQGYAVYRNVSAHGPVDLVGIKDGGLGLFDVKGCAHGGRSTLKPEQIAAGVKVINVYPDDTCEIDWSPLPPVPHWHANCTVCGTQFKRVTRKQKFCSKDCKRVNWLTRKAEKRKNGVIA